MKTTHTKTLSLSLLAVAFAFGMGSCSSEPGIQCGPNTKLDEATNKCVVSMPPGMNIIVDDFVVGDFELTNVDVPEQLEVGSPQTRTFTISNKGKADRPVVSIRYAIVPIKANISELQDQLASIVDGSELDATFLGITFIKDLKAGETRTISYFLAAPNTVVDGLYGFMFAVDEVPLIVTEDGGYAVDYSAAGMGNADGSARLGDAALLHAPASIIIGKPDLPNLRVLSAKVDNSSFELDETEGSKVPMFTLNARMSSQAMNLTELVTATLELKLPGHTPKTPGKDLGREWFEAKKLDFDTAPETTEWMYDQNRSFPLLFQQSAGLAASKVYKPSCRMEMELPVDATDTEAEPVEVEKCAVIFNEEGRDDVYRLHLHPGDIRVLGLTADLAAFNPDIDENGEIAGKLVYHLVTPAAQYQGNTADDTAEIPVVFMAPPAAPAATDKDTDNGGTDVAANAAKGPYSYVVKDDLTQSEVGNAWFGAGYRLENAASNEKRWDVTTAGYRNAGGKVYANILKQEVIILGAGGKMDWNKENPVGQWVAEANLTVFNYKLLNLAFLDKLCKTTDKVTACQIFGNVDGLDDWDPKEESEKTDKGDDADTEEEGTELKKEWGTTFMAGPIPLMFTAEIGLEVGLNYSGKFLIDQSDPVFKYGIEFAIGPYAELKAQVFGGISIGIARAGIEGNLSIIKVEFMPTITFLTRTAVDKTKDCLRYGNTTLTFEGPLTLTGPSGNIQIVAYLGFKFCFFGKCWKWEIKVFSFTIASFSTFEYTWMLWSVQKEWSKQPTDAGMCTDAYVPPDKLVWNSPTSCSGKYCNSSSTGKGASRSPDKVLAAYKSTYDLANVTSGCVDVTVYGITETSNDVVVLYDANGVVQNSVTVKGTKVPGWSGTINQTLRVCSPKVTAAVETDASNTRTGVTVTFNPVR